MGPPFAILQIPERLLASIMAEAQAAYPIEICGLMAGRGGIVERLYHVENRLLSPYAYEMEPAQLVEAMEDMDDQGLEMAAIYHSHPYGPAAPSSTDIAQANYPQAAHAIVSLEEFHKPAIGVFEIVGGTARALPWQSV